MEDLVENYNSTLIGTRLLKKNSYLKFEIEKQYEVEHM